VVRAPFAGIVTRRFVDPGDFAAPGTPLVALADGSRLRISGTLPAGLAARLAPGARLEARIEGRPAAARIEGVAPAGGSVYTINAIVDNPAGDYPVGGAADLLVATGTRSAILIPAAALERQGDLTGVRLVAGATAELRWVRLGERRGEQVEVLAGLRAGDRILLPEASR
jgi:multidrug efflux pump subunit AcrA (membrane-fusion protein)